MTVLDGYDGRNHCPGLSRDNEDLPYDDDELQNYQDFLKNIKLFNCTFNFNAAKASLTGRHAPNSNYSSKFEPNGSGSSSSSSSILEFEFGLESSSSGSSSALEFEFGLRVRVRP